MNLSNVIPFSGPKHQVRFRCDRVLDQKDDHYILEEGGMALCSASLVRPPDVGDQVVIAQTEECSFILSILVASGPETACLAFPGANQLRVVANHIDIVGKKTASINAVNEVSIRSSSNLRLSCKNLTSAVAQSMISIAQHWLTKCDFGSVEAKDLLRTDANNQIVTAKKDLRMDAERINMG